MQYRLAVVVENDHGDVLRQDSRTVPNNAKPDEEWTWMIEQAGKAIFQNWVSNDVTHPFSGAYRVVISRSTVDEDAEELAGFTE